MDGLGSSLFFLSFLLFRVWGRGAPLSAAAMVAMASFILKTFFVG